MRRLYFCSAVALAIFWNGFVARADDKIQGLVLLPNGKPAVGAKVIARQIHFHFRNNAPTRYWATEVTTETDPLGYFDAIVSTITLTAGPGRGMRPYVLIDAPGCALGFLPMTEVQKRVDVKPITVQLQPYFKFQGTVLGPSKKPVPNARVAITGWSLNIVEGSVLNRGPELNTPQLVTTTDKNGRFALRGIANPLEKWDDPKALIHSSGGLMATATVNGVEWSGKSYISNIKYPREAKTNPRKLTVLYLQPPQSISKHVPVGN